MKKMYVLSSLACTLGLLNTGCVSTRKLAETDPNKALFRAISKGSLSGVRVALDNGADVNHYRGPGGYCETPLSTTAWCAEFHGDGPPILRLLIRRGADVSFLSSGRAPFASGDKRVFPTSCKGWLATVVAALEVDVPVHRNHLNSALCHAACYGEIEKVRFLLQRGANANGSAVGTTPLTHLGTGCPGNATEIAELLVQHGADANLRNEAFGQTPLIATVIAAGSGELTWGGRRPKRQAERMRLATFLIANGAHVDGRRKGHPETPLMVAVSFGNTQMTKILLDAGAAPDTALWRAVMHGVRRRRRIVKMLIDAGADVNQKIGGESLLQSAQEVKGSGTIVRMLKKAGAN